MISTTIMVFIMVFSEHLKGITYFPVLSFCLAPYYLLEGLSYVYGLFLAFSGVVHRLAFKYPFFIYFLLSIYIFTTGISYFFFLPFLYLDLSRYHSIDQRKLCFLSSFFYGIYKLLSFHYVAFIECLYSTRLSVPGIISTPSIRSLVHSNV